MGKIIFSDEKERCFLNELIHPLVLEKKKVVISRLEKEGHYNIFISEAALTIEAGFAGFFDKIIMAYCKKEVQKKRLMERDGISRKQTMNIIKSQMQPQEKLKYADYIIDTSSSLQSTVEQTERVYRNLMMDNEIKNSIAKHEF